MLFATLTLLVSRRRCKIAMWILIAWFVLNVTSAIILLTTNIIVYLGRIWILQAVGQVVAHGLPPSARRWMRRGDEKAA